jgi:predicted alpha-1,6-mannanase (GH76 family)
MKYQTVFLSAILLSMPFAWSQTGVSNEAELKAMAENPEGSYILTQDIVLTGNWTPLCSDVPFKGVLDGNGHAIRHLRIESAANFVGLFARTEGATIQNLAIVDPEIIATQAGACAAILIAEAGATTVSATGIAGGRVTGKGAAASLIGQMPAGAGRSHIVDSYSSANIQSERTAAGGLAAIARNLTVTNACFAGTIQNNGTPGEAMPSQGGIIAVSEGDNSVSNCLVLSASIIGSSPKRIAGKQTSGVLTLSNNYAREDLLIGNSRNPRVLPVDEWAINGQQGESVPYASSGYVSGLPAYTAADVATALQAFNQIYYSNTKKLYFEKYTKSGKVAAIWTQAIYFDIAMNAWIRTGSNVDKRRMEDLFEGNGNQYDHYNWDNGVVWFIYDDIMWWVISLARAYELTGDNQYLTLSQSGFERVWSGSSVLKDKGSYDPVNGGMYWAWDQKNPEGSPVATMGKMACINYPTVVGAMTLFNATQDSVYYRKAQEIYTWARNNLFDRATGRVADSKHGAGSPNWGDHVYNQATCIGAAVMLYKATGNRMYLEDAILAANYTKNRMSAGSFLHYETGIEQGIYHAIFAQYIVRLINDCEQYQYLPWLRYNLDYGWQNRLSNDITFKNYGSAAPAIAQIESYDASGLPALMQVIPPRGENEKEVHCKSRVFYEKNLNWDMDGVWTLSATDSLPRLKSLLTSGIEKAPDAKRHANIYSNDGRLFIDVSEPSTVEVYDTAGWLCERKKIAERESLALPRGMYVVRTASGSALSTQKVFNH